MEAPWFVIPHVGQEATGPSLDLIRSCHSAAVDVESAVTVLEDVVGHGSFQGFAEQEDDLYAFWVDVHDGISKVQTDGSGIKGGEQVPIKDDHVLSRFGA
jgi:hypothetical protein